ncbi:hypothetical protein Bca4012_072055 [Brassica carinata]
MLSSQFVIVFIILIALFRLHECIVVDGQGLETGKETCKQTKWGKHKNLTCLFVSPKLGLRTGVKRA